ncbi:hypothetical protein NJT12_07915 [Flavobacterium sp. AC]|uniref:Methylamine utilisation protein MauE domain-containing protein n=1 Tax=Flavobacterium azizsancarii TaxID=2961580 RepID=A0ABT4WAI2_9FLAO|nr:MauE/DoxX family redox-associated membrane protein [Flavobacterium azizsancarii]MDA6069541.1 hypothetical protein [Flavobacterium azizsancarii]
MNVNKNIKTVSLKIIYLLCVTLFIYAATSKILDFENFQVHLGQSPLLSIYASWISWLVIVIEVLVAALLVVPKSRTLGLYLALSLMTMFSAYIFILLHFGSFVPCSCGGILEKMSWNAHLIFNLVFVILAILAIGLNRQEKKPEPFNYIFLSSFKPIAATLVTSILAIVLLFVFSEEVMHHRNPFLRRYPQHPAEYSASFKLKHNSYYIVGLRGNRIILGNYEFPSYLMSFDSDLKDQKIQMISFSPGKIPFKNIYITLQEPHFYLYDGSVPVLFRGDAKNWSITKEFEGMPYFTKLVPIDGASVAFRSNNSVKLANVLGVFKIDSIPKINYKRDLLQKQIDGIFDTDGILLYSNGIKKIVYLYYYRNEFIVADQNGTLQYRGHTIDTISKARLKVSTLKGGKQYALSSPSDVVNSKAAVYKNLLFVHSLVRGQYEDETLWQKSFIIDVYDLTKGSYLMSFPIYHTSSSTLNSFAVTQDYLSVIIGEDLVVYKLKNVLKKEITKK